MSFFVSENIKNALDEKSFYDSEQIESPINNNSPEKYNAVAANNLIILIDDKTFDINRITFKKSGKLQVNFICMPADIYQIIKQENVSRVCILFGKGKSMNYNPKNIKVVDICKRFTGNCYSMTIIITEELSGV